MEIPVLVSLSVVYLICVWGFLCREQLFAKESKNRIANAFSENKAVTVFVILSALASVGVVLLAMYVYKVNSFTTNLKLLTLLNLLIITAVTDFKNHIIPNVIIIAGLIIRIVFAAIEFAIYGADYFSILKSDAIALAIVAALAFVGVVVIKNGIAMGDIKLLLVMGLFLGMSGFFSALFFALVFAFVLGLFFLITKKKKRKDVLAFAPALFLGTLLAVVLTRM